MSNWELGAEQFLRLDPGTLQLRRLLGSDWVDRERIRRYLPVKRAMDIVGAIVGIAFLAPAMIASSILIFVVSPGTILFRHKRVGQFGREFRCFKLRSMRPEAEALLADWLATDHHVRAEFEKGFKLKRDPRIIPFVGVFLRRSSLDEAPQFINILKGEMSLVGPRPIVAAERKKYGAAYRYVSSVKPGLTGLWQVSGRNDLSYEERVDLDLRYVAELGFWRDIAIIVRTFRAVAELGGM